MFTFTTISTNSSKQEINKLKLIHVCNQTSESRVSDLDLLSSFRKSLKCLTNVICPKKTFLPFGLLRKHRAIYLFPFSTLHNGFIDRKFIIYNCGTRAWACESNCNYFFFGFFFLYSFLIFSINYAYVYVCIDSRIGRGLCACSVRHTIMYL